MKYAIDILVILYIKKQLKTITLVYLVNRLNSEGMGKKTKTGNSYIL